MNKFDRKDAIYLAIGLILIAIDYITKLKVNTNLKVGESIPVIENFFHITFVQNRGAAFGMFQDKKIVFLIVGAIAIVFLLKLFVSSKDVITKISITMIVSGAIGNIIDRILYGYVVDMLDFRGIWSYVFNFADVCVVLGVFVMSICIFRSK